MKHSVPVDVTPFVNDLQGATPVLTPGLRLARAITAAWHDYRLGSVSVGAVPVPQVFTIDAWLEGLWRQCVESGVLPVRRLLSRLEERLIWKRIVDADCASAGGFNLVQVNAAAEQAMRCRNLLYGYAADPWSSEVRESFRFDRDCAAFMRWLVRFEEELSNAGYLTRSDCYRQLLSLPVTALPSNPQRVVLAHCATLQPLTQRVLSHVAIPAWVPAQPVGSADRLGTEAPGTEALGTEASLEEGRHVGLSGDCYPDRLAELSAVARWAARRLREGQGTTAIVLLDMEQDRSELEYFLREEFDCLDARYNDLPVNFSTGMPLAETPLFRDGLLALRAGLEPLTRAETLSLLRSPFLLEPDFPESEGCLKLIAALMNLACDPIDCDDFVHLASQCVPESVLSKVLTARRQERSRAHLRAPSAWADVIRQDLLRWGWPGRPSLDSIEFQQIERLDTSLDALYRLSAIERDVSFTRAVQLWRLCLAEHVFQPKTPHSAIQVLGPQEAIGLHFDALHVVGMIAGSLPPLPRLLPFIPAEVQRSLGIPGASAELLYVESAGLLRSWQSTHGTVTASCYREEQGIAVLASPLLIIETAFDELPLEPSNTEPVTLERLNDSSAPTTGEMLPHGGGTAVLRNQSQCPFRAWVTHRLGPTTLAEPAFGLTAIERGSLVHEALYYLWRDLSDQSRLKAMSDDDREQCVRVAVQRGLAIFEKRVAKYQGSLRKRAGNACLDLEIERLVVLLIEWLAIEADRSEPFKVVEGEEEHWLNVGPLNLRMRPDRVDELSDGRRVVIDYKTGSVTAASWLGERPKEPQLPTYTLLDNPVSGVAFAQLKHGKAGFTSLGDNLGLGGKQIPLVDQLSRTVVSFEDWESLRAYWQDILTELANRYAAGDAQVDPAPQACRYCDLASVCRIGTEAIADTADEDVPSVAWNRSSSTGGVSQ